MSGSNGRGFDAEARAKERESGPIRLAEDAVYHPRRLTNRRLRQIRALSREATSKVETLAKATDEYREALEKAKADGLEEARAEEVALEAGYAAEEVAEVNSDSVSKQLCLLLVDDGGQPPDEARIRHHVDEDLDFRDVEALMQHLVGTPDPTPPETAAASSS